MTARLHPSLPIFRLVHGASHVLYTPGYLAVVTPDEADGVRSALLAGAGGKVAEELRGCAERAVEAWRRRMEAPFAPECLTVYLSNQCNLACPYCFSRAGPPPGAVLEEKSIGAAARLVASCCAEKNKPFHLVLHGGGEPALHWDTVVRTVAATRGIAAEAGVGWLGFIATNGVLPESTASWLARNFDLVELSCDGPPEIQDRQRPLAGGGASSPHVGRTARTIVENGGRFTVRTTITPHTAERQAEIVAYLHEALGATRMRFEPVYRVRSPRQAEFRADQAECFVEHFLAAQREARRRGCDLGWAGVRLDELHGPYCNVLRDTLHLVPYAAATACFFCTGSQSGRGEPQPIGRPDSATGEYLLDVERIAAHRRKAASIPARCNDCINIFHCARECPEVCYAVDPPGDAEQPTGFRCLVQRRLAEEWIEQAAGRAEATAPFTLT